MISISFEHMVFKKEVFYTKHGWVDVEKTIGKEVYKSCGNQNSNFIDVEMFKYLNVELYKVVYDTEDKWYNLLIIQMLKGLVYDAKSKKIILLRNEEWIDRERMNWYLKEIILK